MTTDLREIVMRLDELHRNGSAGDVATHQITECTRGGGVTVNRHHSIGPKALELLTVFEHAWPAISKALKEEERE